MPDFIRLLLLVFLGSQRSLILGLLFPLLLNLLEFLVEEVGVGLEGALGLLELLLQRLHALDVRLHLQFQGVDFFICWRGLGQADRAVCLFGTPQRSLQAIDLADFLDQIH